MRPTDRKCLSAGMHVETARSLIVCTGGGYCMTEELKDPRTEPPRFSHLPSQSLFQGHTPAGRPEFIFELDRKNVCHFLCGAPYELGKLSLIMHRIFPLQMARLNVQFKFTLRFFLLFTLHVDNIWQHSEQVTLLKWPPMRDLHRVKIWSEYTSASCLLYNQCWYWDAKFGG